MTIPNMIAGNNKQRCINNAQGQVVYLGYAQPGVATSAAVWQIRKITYDSMGAMTQVDFAEGSNAFDKIFDDYASYTYS